MHSTYSVDIILNFNRRTHSTNFTALDICKTCCGSIRIFNHISLKTVCDLEKKKNFEFSLLGCIL